MSFLSLTSSPTPPNILTPQQKQFFYLLSIVYSTLAFFIIPSLFLFWLIPNNCPTLVRVLLVSMFGGWAVWAGLVSVQMRTLLRKWEEVEAEQDGEEEEKGLLKARERGEEKEGV